MPHIAVFTDCHDTNARARQEVRYRALLPMHDVTVYPVLSEQEAAGCIIDALDASLGVPVIIVGNVAPRGVTHDENGCPFSYTKVGDAIIIGTPNVFQLLPQFGAAKSVEQTDVYRASVTYLPESEARRIANSQFRSYEYLPHLASWLHAGRQVPATTVPISPSESAFVWCVDNFGNMKTSATDITELSPTFRALPFIPRLTDVPHHTAAVTVGSSGLRDKRFLEIVISGKSAKEHFGLTVGAPV